MRDEQTPQDVCGEARDTTHFDSEDDSAQVVETSVTVNNNSLVQDYVHWDDQSQPTFEMTAGFKPFTITSLSELSDTFSGVK